MLSLLWLLPTFGALLVAALPRSRARLVGATAAAATLALALVVAARFEPGRQGYQFEENVPWIAQYSVAYHLGVDGISLWLLVLNALLAVVAIASATRAARLRGYIALLLLLEAAMTGVFLAADLLLFYIFWEAMLIPAYFLLWIWGEGERPLFAAFKFVLYTLAGSLLMLVGVIGEYVYAGRTFDLAQLAAHPPAPGIQFGLFALFALGFSVKVPVFPFHSWLPDAYAAAPASFLALFAGVMGKTGAYGMLRILIPLLPQPQSWWDWNGVMPVLAVLGIGWGALMAVAQRDMKLLVAYSSLSHMGFIVLGIFAFNAQGQQGAVLQMVNHGIIVAALFLLVAWVASRTGTRDRGALKDLAPAMPVMAGVFLIVVMAAIGLPGLNSFVGEFMTLLGAWQYSPALTVAACAGLLLAPVYMLRMFQGIFYAGVGETSRTEADASTGQSSPAAAAAPPDLRAGEILIVAPLIALMFVLGLYPYLLTQVMPALGYPLPAAWR